MGFMEAQMTGKEFWYAVDGPMGVDYIPEDITGYVSLAGWARGDAIPEALRDYTENTRADSITREYGYGVRSSAPGYMDCTPWTVYRAKRDAVKAYNEERRACRGED